MNCHSERSEESPHFVRSAILYIIDKKRYKLLIPDIDKSKPSGMKIMQT
jgi:hypothetical protein